MEKFPSTKVETSEASSERAERVVFTNAIFDGEQQVSKTETEVLVSNKRLINKNLNESSGGFGVVYAVDVQIPGDDKKYPFVLKEFHGAGTESAKKDARAALLNHRLAKQAGLKVWNTYRISENEDSILMTSGNAEEWQIIGDFSRLSAEQHSELLQIKNFTEFLQGYYQEAVRAAKQGIIIASDVPFFRVQNNKIDFILGDLDQLEVSEKPEQEILSDNLQSMHSRLVTFFENNFGNMEDEDSDEGFAGEAEKYIQQSDQYISRTFHQTVTRHKEI